MSFLAILVAPICLIVLFILFYRRYSPAAVQKRHASNIEFGEKYIRIRDAIKYCFRKENALVIEEDIADLRKDYGSIVKKADEMCDFLVDQLITKRSSIVKDLNKERKSKY